MTKIIAVVEGQGEIAAVPLLLRRIAAEVYPDLPVQVLRPLLVSRHRVMKKGELERAIEQAARRSGKDGRILVLLDADDDCPATLGPELLRRAISARTDRAIKVVLPKTEYESWFLAATPSIAGRRGIRASIVQPSNPESVRDAKGWLSDQMPERKSYRPTYDQAALTSAFDLSAARVVSPSFDKLWRDVCELLQDSPKGLA